MAVQPTDTIVAVDDQARSSLSVPKPPVYLEGERLPHLITLPPTIDNLMKKPEKIG
ncbi:MAG: hypothetical protein HC801_07085 [Nitrospira sp.]|nr:hypothetical protein [Nitrospira sp.]